MCIEIEIQGLFLNLRDFPTGKAWAGPTETLLRLISTDQNKYISNIYK